MASPSHPDDPAYTDAHRAFLQAFVSRQILTYADAKPLISAIETAHDPARATLPEDVSPQHFDDYVQRANAALSPFEFEIRSAGGDDGGGGGDGDRVWALVNTTSDALTQMATRYAADELAYIKRVLDAMFDTNNTARAEVCAVPGMQALKLAKAPAAAAAAAEDTTTTPTASASPAASITMAQAEKVLARLVAERWLSLSPAGFYALAPRGRMELRAWLLDTYNDESDSDSGAGAGAGGNYDARVAPAYVKIKLCAACRDIVTVGRRCANPACLVRLHDPCVATLFRAQAGRETCPKCLTPWTHAPPVGEKAAAAPSALHPVAPAAKRRRSGPRPSRVEGDSDASADG